MEKKREKSPFRVVLEFKIYLKENFLSQLLLFLYSHPFPGLEKNRGKLERKTFKWTLCQCPREEDVALTPSWGRLERMRAHRLRFIDLRSEPPSE